MGRSGRSRRSATESGEALGSSSERFNVAQPEPVHASSATTWSSGPAPSEDVFVSEGTSDGAAADVADVIAVPTATARGSVAIPGRLVGAAGVLPASRRQIPT